MNAIENERLLTALRAALEAGAEIMQVYDDPAQDFGVEHKADNSPLTLADKRAHACIAARLEPLGVPVLSEEGRHLPYEERRVWRELWVVDPLDGTKEFIKRNGEFTVNIALVREGVPVMGVIYVPVKRTLYFAADGLGAFRMDGVQPCADAADSVENMVARGARLPLAQPNKRCFTIVASRSHQSPETVCYIEHMRHEHTDVEVVSSGSSIKICLVAEGAADVYPRFAPTMEWDTAAGQAIARAAGKNVYETSALNRPLRYNKENLLNPWFIVE